MDRGQQNAGASGRNVVLVTADSVRADHCGHLDGVDLTPNLDGLAADGVTFDNAVAPGPRTPTSVPETLTGEPMAHVSADSFGAQVSRITDHLDRHETLPERLSAEGYTTIGFSANPWFSTRCNMDEKFDVFRDISTDDRNAVHDADLPWISGTDAETVARWIEQWWHKTGFFSQWPTFFDEVVAAVESADEPYFLWTFLLDSHNPYLVARRDRVESSTPGMYYGMLRGNRAISHSSDESSFKTELSPRVRTHVERAYRDSVRSVDRFLGRVVRATREDAPILAFHADHGEAFGEHGTFGHQQALYEENVHVPLVVWRANGESDRIADPVSLRVLPDLLVSLARGDDWASDRWTDEYVVARSEDGSTLAVRSADAKYVRTPDSEEFYDLRDDPCERRNLLGGGEIDPDTSEFRQAVDEYLRTVPQADGRLRETAVSTDVQRRLSMLGYDE